MLRTAIYLTSLFQIIFIFIMTYVLVVFKTEMVELTFRVTQLINRIRTDVLTSDDRRRRNAFRASSLASPPSYREAISVSSPLRSRLDAPLPRPDPEPRSVTLEELATYVSSPNDSSNPSLDAHRRRRGSQDSAHSEHIAGFYRVSVHS